jgi:hypothetical protein
LNLTNGLDIGSANRGKTDQEVATTILNGLSSGDLLLGLGVTVERDMDTGRPKLRAIAPYSPSAAVIECAKLRINNPDLQGQSCTQALQSRPP